MIKNTKAFTIIELIVVSSILILVSATSVFYFGDFLDSYKLKGRLSLIEKDFENLDSKVKSKDIFDYELHLEPGKENYIVYENSFDLENNAKLSLSGDVGTLDIYPNFSGDWELKISSNKKEIVNTVLSGNDNFNISLATKNNHSIYSSLSGEKINNISLNYFLKDPSEETFSIDEINTIEDKSGDNINNLVIKNIGGKKQIIGDNNNYNEAYIFFSFSGKQDFIKITKK